MEPEGVIASPPPPNGGRGLPLVAALATLCFSAALGCVAVRRWRRAAFWLLTDWLWVGIMIGGVHRGHPRAMWVGLCGFFLWRIPAAIDAFRVARAAREQARWQTLIVAWVVLGIAGLGGWRGSRQFFAESFTLPAAGMSPTLRIGDHIMVDKRARRPDRGDVVVFESPLDRSTDYVKRVVALGGDTVEVVKGTLIVNGKEVTRERVQNGCPDGAAPDEGVPCVIWEETVGDRRYQVGMDPVTGPRDLERRVVPPGTVFVLGDNRDNSSDSRVWGPVPLENLKGTVRFIYWSMEPDGRARWDRVNLIVR